MWCFPHVLRQLQLRDLSDQNLKEKLKYVESQFRTISSWQRLFSAALGDKKNPSRRLSVPKGIWFLVDFQDRIDETIEFFKSSIGDLIRIDEYSKRERQKLRDRYNEYISSLEKLLDKVKYAYPGEAPNRKSYYRL